MHALGHRADWKQCSLKLVDFLSRRLSSTFRWNGQGIVCLPSRIPIFLKIKIKKKITVGHENRAVGDDKQLIFFTRPNVWESIGHDGGGTCSWACWGWTTRCCVGEVCPSCVVGFTYLETSAGPRLDVRVRERELHGCCQRCLLWLCSWCRLVDDPFLDPLVQVWCERWCEEEARPFVFLNFCELFLMLAFVDVALELELHAEDGELLRRSSSSAACFCREASANRRSRVDMMELLGMLLVDDRVSQSPYLFAGRPAVDRWLRRTGAGGGFELGRSMSTAQRRNVKDKVRVLAPC